MYLDSIANFFLVINLETQDILCFVQILLVTKLLENWLKSTASR